MQSPFVVPAFNRQSYLHTEAPLGVAESPVWVHKHRPPTNSLEKQIRDKLLPYL